MLSLICFLSSKASVHLVDHLKGCFDLDWWLQFIYSVIPNLFSCSVYKIVLFSEYFLTWFYIARLSFIYFTNQFLFIFASHFISMIKHLLYMIAVFCAFAPSKAISFITNSHLCTYNQMYIIMNNRGLNTDSSQPLSSLSLCGLHFN